jgi:hypothetical protein
MSWRFRKRLRIIPGLWINLSKKGGSLSVGGHGLPANVSKRGVRETVGLPGTGISYHTKRIWVQPGKTRPRASQSPALSAHSPRRR